MAFNINVGLLGHVDSGKTSLSKALSKISSTAAFDKNPQSQQRGKSKNFKNVINKSKIILFKFLTIFLKESRWTWVFLH